MQRPGERLHLTVYGQPKGAGSKTAEPLGKPRQEVRDASGRIVLKYRHATKGTAEWMELVAKEAAIAWRGRAALDAALWVDLTCFETRPDDHFFQRKAGWVLRPDAPAYPAKTTTHDSGKMRRAVEDALTEDPKGKWAAVWVDDKRVVDGHDCKRYCNAEHPEPKAIIRVGLMVEQTAEDLGEVAAPPEGQVALV